MPHTAVSTLSRENRAWLLSRKGVHMRPDQNLPQTYGSLSLTICIRKGGRNDIFASFTKTWSDPSLSARILYPRLCQSIMTLLPRNVPTSHTKARVGMLGGFFDIFLIPRMRRDDERTYLHEYELGRVRDAP